MKKSIFIGAIALITLFACQNEMEETTPKTEKNADIAINAVKLVQNNPSGLDVSKPAQMEASIDCHTSYFLGSGNSCVWVSGQLFNVSWYTNQVAASGGANYSEKVYRATAVSFCNCN